MLNFVACLTWAWDL